MTSSELFDAQASCGAPPGTLSASRASVVPVPVVVTVPSPAWSVTVQRELFSDAAEKSSETGPDPAADAAGAAAIAATVKTAPTTANAERFRLRNPVLPFRGGTITDSYTLSG
jgi:hypothetical protein